MNNEFSSIVCVLTWDELVIALAGWIVPTLVSVRGDRELTVGNSGEVTALAEGVILVGICCWFGKS